MRRTRTTSVLLVPVLSTLGIAAANAADPADSTQPADSADAHSPLRVAQTDAAGSEAPAPGQANAEALEEVAITGSRIIRDGYQAPTPVSVLGADELNAIAATNISDSVNRMPAFAASVTPHNSATSISSGTAGINNLNLRGLGPIRTLVLVDGHRIAGSTISGFNNNGSAVDTNVIPEALVTHVDVVTGGASAAYGSDALSGVVNFVMDHNFTGFKADVTGGLTTYGDDATYKVALTGGVPFAGDRGHLIVSLERTYNDGIRNNPRPWAKNAWLYIANPNYTPTNGQPSLITRPNVSMSITAPGGLIQGGPLGGIYFGQGGTPLTYHYGAENNGFEMAGGDWQVSRIDLAPDLDIHLGRNTLFSRLSFNITDNVELYAEAHGTDTHADQLSVPQFDFGTTITLDNPFIPPSILARAQALGVSSFSVGSTNADLTPIGADNDRKFRRYLVGVNGKLDMFGSNWTWDAYAGRSYTDLQVRAPFNHLNALYALATDAVVGPNGDIVCRSTLTDPSNGCVPYNVMGIGVNTQAAKDYVLGTGFKEEKLSQDAASATLRGQPFSLWAGSVSLAAGVEYRKEKVDGHATALDEANAFFAGNYHASHGSYNVKEGFLETVVPLAKDMFLAKSLDLNAVVRETDYSTSGNVTTWKLGLTYSPIDDVRFRFTRSRDIRAPNLGDLFSAGQSGTGTVFDPSNGITTTINSPVTGNPDLKPEEADTTGIGVIFSPTFLEGFNASVDYYKIDINGAISTLTAQQYVDRCFAGETTLCSFIQRTNGLISFITIKPANVLSQETHGVDIEASYRRQLGPGNIALRAFGTYVMALKTIDRQSVTDGAGVNADGLTVPFAPKFRFTASASYNLDPITVTLMARGIGSGKYANNYIACTTGCPPSTAEHPTIDNNHISPVTYYDFSLNYAFSERGEAFFVAENFMNRDPPAVAGNDNSGGFYAGQGNTSLYDRLGRMYRAGIRVKF